MNKPLLAIIILIAAATSCRSQKIKIRQHSFIGKMAAKINHTDKYAITLWNTIYINCDSATFVNDDYWFKHELHHVEQWHRYGKLEFIKRYLFYSVLGHDNNPLEIEADKN